MLHMPPIVMADVTVVSGRAQRANARDGDRAEARSRCDARRRRLLDGRAPRRPRRHRVSRQGLLVDAPRPLPGGRAHLPRRPAQGRRQHAEARFWSDIATSEALEPLRARARRRVRGLPPREGRPDRRRHGRGRSAASTRRSCASSRDHRRGRQRRRRRRLQPAARRGARRQRVRRAEPRRARARAPATSARSLIHTSTCYVAGVAQGPDLRGRPARRIPFPRARASSAPTLWDPDREIAECLDLIAQAKHRADDAFRQSEFAEQARQEPRARAASRRTAQPFDARARAGEAQVRRRERLVEAGHRPRDPLGLAEHLHVHEGIGEQVIAAQRPAVHDRAPGVLRVDASSSRSPGWNEGINTSAPLIYLIMKGQMQILGRARAARPHPDRLRRRGDDPRARRAPRGHAPSPSTSSARAT